MQVLGFEFGHETPLRYALGHPIPPPIADPAIALAPRKTAGLFLLVKQCIPKGAAHRNVAYSTQLEFTLFGAHIDADVEAPACLYQGQSRKAGPSFVPIAEHFIR
jgi:hypothetical protein